MRSQIHEGTVPGGGLLKRRTPLTDSERMQYVKFFADKGIKINPEQVKLMDGTVYIVPDRGSG